MTASAAPSPSNLAAQIATWRDGSRGFFQFVADVQPHVRSHLGGFAPYTIGDRERNDIAAALDNPDTSVAVWCWPRRHGKTLASAMVIVWRFLTRPTENIAVVANSEKQVTDTAFRTIRETFEHTPKLKRLVAAGTISVLLDRIELPSTGSVIQAFSSNPSALWGKKLSCAQISELHAAPKGDEVFAALAGSLLDTAGSILLIDSTVGPKSSKLFDLYQAATRDNDPDPSIVFSHIEYADVADACAKAPAWLSPAKLKSLSRQMLPHEFALYHLNRWSDAANSLFPRDVLDACVHEYPLDLDALTCGSAHVVGVGLDRAFGGSKHGDRTVAACVVKVSIDDDEHLYVLDADTVFLSRLSGIKSRFTDLHRRHGISRAVLESYGCQDVADWSATQPYASGVEVVHPSRRSKYAGFMGLYQAAAEQRLHVHPKFRELINEMSVFEVVADGKATDGEAAIPKFQHPRGAHDDYVHALCWAAYSLRTVTLNPYEIEGIHCGGRGADVAMCALNGGAHIPFCGQSCRSMGEATRLHAAYLSRKPVQPVPLDTFIIEKLRNVGAHTLPR